jgi:cation diffusion facilitator family transporter
VRDPWALQCVLTHRRALACDGAARAPTQSPRRRPSSAFATLALAGLIADAFHNAFHCVGLGVSLVGMLYAERPPTFAYSYGYDRHEVLAAFANALFLVFLCAYVIVGALHRLVEPSHLVPDTARILEFGLASLAINVAGVLTVTGVPGGAGAGGSLDYAHKFTASVAAAGGGASAGSQLLAWLGLGGGGGGGDLPLPATGSAGRGAHASNVRAVHITFLSHVVSSSAVVASSLLVRFFGIVWVSRRGASSGWGG